MSLVGPLLPALVPLTTLLWLRAADHSVSISRGSWDLEYDYIIGEYGELNCALVSGSDKQTKVV